MIINNNLSANKAVNCYGKNVKESAKSLKNLSSGLAIGVAADNAAGLAISEKMRATIFGLQQASRNVQDGISMLQTAEGGLNEGQSVLQRMRELSVKAATDSLTSGDRMEIQKEMNQLKENLDEISRTTEYNTKKLLDGTSSMLYSVSDDRLQVMAMGAIRSKAADGSITSLEGNYRLNIAATAGKGQVQSSQVMEMSSGMVGGKFDQTRAGAYSGLTDIKAKGLNDGEYRVMTREKPFGGINYTDEGGGAVLTANITAALGISNVSTTSNPDILPFGQYNVDVAKTLPFMATFADNAVGVDVIKGVNNTDTSIVDVDMDVTAGAAASNASSTVNWDRIHGGGPAVTIDNAGAGGLIDPLASVALSTNLANTSNVFTHFAVTGRTDRTTLAANVTANTYYRSDAASTVDMNLIYKTHAGDTIDVTADYRSKAGETVSVETTYLATAGTDITLNIGGFAQLPALAVGGRTVAEVAADLQARSIADGWNVTFTTVAGAFGQQRIQVVNNRAPAIPANEVTFATVPDDGLGLNGLTLAGAGGSGLGNSLDLNHGHSLGVGGTSLAGVAAGMNGTLAGYGFAVSAVTAAGEGHLQIANTSTNYRLHLIGDGAPDSVETELGLNGFADMSPLSGNFNSAVNVFDGKVINVAAGGKTINQLAADLQTAVTTPVPGGSAVNIGLTVTAGAAGLVNMAMGSDGDNMYRLTIADSGGGTTAAELGINGAVINQRGGAGANSVNVYNNFTEIVSVGSMRTDAVRNALDAALTARLALDGLANNAARPFTFSAGAGTANVDINNTAANSTFYDINLKDNVGNVVNNELWNHGAGGFTVARDTNDASGLGRDYNKAIGTVATAGQNIEQARTELLGDLTAAGLSVTAAWTTQPDYNGQHNGQFQLVNNEDGVPDRREIVFGGGAAQLLQAGTLDVNPGGNGLSQLWQARDAVQIRTSYVVGSDNTGNNGGTAGTYNNTWWEGDRGTLNPLVGAANIPFSELYIPDNNKVGGAPADLAVGDTWAVYTTAQTVGAQDNIAVDTYEQGTAANHIPPGGYHFNAGAVNNRTNATASLHMAQMFDTGGAGFGVVMHDIETGTLSTQADAVRYNRRYATPAPPVGMSAYDHNAHVAPSSGSTYFFANGQTLTANVTASVWRQEDDNSSMLCTVLAGNQLRVQGKGYDRNGTANDFDVTVAMPAGGPITIGAIQFDDLTFNNTLAVNDKFVLNVTARAGGNGTGYFGTANNSDSSLNITGNPWSQGGSSMEYRFEENGENGKTFDTLGWFVHPTDGADPAIGVWTGEVNVEAAGGGFNAGTRWGTNNVQLEINYSGTTDYRAAAVTTGYFFQDKLRSEPTSAIIKTVNYDVDSMQNASAMFEVLGVVNGRVAMRGQAHIYDKQGNYRYDYEDYFWLGGNDKNITLFKDDQGNNGLTFTEFSFTDTSRLRKGDKFSLFMAANAEPDGTSTDDEIFLFANGDTRNLYPQGWRFSDGVLDNKRTEFKSFQIDYDTGEVFNGEVQMEFKDFHGGTASGVVGSSGTPQVINNTVSFNSSYQHGVDLGTAHLYTKLKDIAEFWNSDGQYLLEQPQTIQISNNGKTAQLHLYAGDTVMDVMDRLNETMFDKFGQSAVMAEGDRYKFARLVDTAQQGRVFETAEGTMVLRTAVAGQAGEISFAGDEQLLNAFGLQVVRAAQENSYTAEITDLETGKVVVAAEKMSAGGATPTALSDKLNLRLDGTVGQGSAAYDLSADDIELDTVSSAIDLHIKDNTTVLQIGAGQMQDVYLDLGNISAKGLGVADVSVVTQNGANQAMGKIDKALGVISSQRAAIGAMHNRLEKADNALTAAMENLTMAESKIRDLDMAKETMRMTKGTILLNASMNVVAQANGVTERVLQLLK